MKTAYLGVPELAPGVVCELYSIVLADGYALNFTTGDSNLDYYGTHYLSGAVNIDRGTIRTAVGVNVDEVSITIYPRDSDAGGPAFTNRGGFDGAWVTIFRVNRDGGVYLFKGMVSDAVADRTKVELTVSSATLLLNIDMPRNVYTAGCGHTLFDAGCGLVKANFAHASAVAPAGATTRFLWCGLIQESGYFNLGTLSFTSGVNAGVTRTIKNYEVGAITLSYPLQTAPAVGDTFVAYPGCDKRMVETCKDKFNNLSNYRGFPFIPPAEATI